MKEKQKEQKVGLGTGKGALLSSSLPADGFVTSDKYKTVSCLI